jgi:hypothetical protein
LTSRLASSTSDQIVCVSFVDGMLSSLAGLS